jgi:trimeric autotransporter adhesin
MGTWRIAGTNGLRRRGPALLAGLAVAVATLAGAGQAAAAAHSGEPGGPRPGAAGVISTVAGGVGGPGRATGVAMLPCGVASGGGEVYIGTGAAVRKVSPAGDWLTTPAGTGLLGAVISGRRATKAFLDGACAVGVDGFGNLVIADSGNDRVEVVAASTGSFYGQAMTVGDIYTVAGTGSSGFSGDGGPATSAELDRPSGVAVDGAGNLVIADTDNERVRVVAASTGSFYGQAMTAGDIYTVAGTGTRGSSGDGGPATSAKLDGPLGVAVDGAGNLVIADTGNDRVRVVAASTGSFYGRAMTAGDIYTVAGTGTRGSSGDGGPATSAKLDRPDGVVVDGAGNLVIADSANDRVRVVAASTGSFYGRAMTAGDIYAVAGDGTGGFSGDGVPATRAELDFPESVAVDGAGNLVTADTDNQRVRVAAARTGSFYGQAMTAGHIYTVAGTGSYGFSGDGGPATSAELAEPSGVVVDGAGNLLIADLGNNRVRVVAASTGSFYGQAMTAGHIYTVAGTGSYGFSGDGGPATSAELAEPYGVAVDGAGNLVIADTYNERVRVVAASTASFYGQAMTAGDIYTVAGDGTRGFSGDGGPATSAKLDGPSGVAVDGAGNLVIADSGNDRVRVVAASTGSFYGQAMTAGDIYTVAGTGKPGFSGDGGPATSAELDRPDGVVVDGAGNLVIADTYNDRVRVVAASTGSFYGQAMTAGDIYTVAGTGKRGFSHDGGQATRAKLDLPQSVVVDGAGNLVIADTNNNRIREVTG